jgi:flagellar biosynthesis/type III secretory pathway protein FliH
MGVMKSRYKSALLQAAYAEGLAKGRGEAYAEGYAEGFAEGFARAVLWALAARGLTLSEESAERVRGCRDQAQLEIWLDRAIVVDSAEEIFD